MCSRNARCVATCNSDVIVESSSGGLTWSTTQLQMIARGVYCDIEDFCVVAGNDGIIMASEVISTWRSVGALSHGGSISVDAYNPDLTKTTMAGPWKSSSDSSNIGMILSSNGTYWYKYDSVYVENFDFLVSNWDNNHWIGANRTGTFKRSVDISPSCNWDIELESPSSTIILDVNVIFDDFVATGYGTDK